MECQDHTSLAFETKAAYEIVILKTTDSNIILKFLTYSETFLTVDLQAQDARHWVNISDKFKNERDEKSQGYVICLFALN